MNEAELLAKELQSLAVSTGSHIIAAPLDTSQMPSPSVILSLTELLSFIAAVRPPIVYAFETALDADAEIEPALEEMGVERGDRAFDEVTRAARGLAAHQGESARVSVEIMAGGVLHICYAAASWIIEFDGKVEAIAARVAEEGKARLHGAKQVASEHVRALARQILANPAFDTGRPSLAKRRFLAGEMFPDENERTLDIATEMADNMRWLASSG